MNLNTISLPWKARPTNIYFLLPKISKFLSLSIGNSVNFIWGKESVILMMMPPSRHLRIFKKYTIASFPRFGAAIRIRSAHQNSRKHDWNNRDADYRNNRDGRRSEQPRRRPSCGRDRFSIVVEIWMPFAARMAMPICSFRTHFWLCCLICQCTHPQFRRRTEL
jgi:hypothetical protein